MAAIGLEHSTKIDSIGDIVTGDLRTCWKCQQGTRAQVQNRQFYRICVSQTRWLDSDGRPHWPHRVMRTCHWETGLKCRLHGEYYIMENSLFAGRQQSNSFPPLRPFYDWTDGWMGFLWEDPDRSTQGEVGYIGAHQCQSRRYHCVKPHTHSYTWEHSPNLESYLRSLGSQPDLNRIYWKWK